MKINLEKAFSAYKVVKNPSSFVYNFLLQRLNLDSGSGSKISAFQEDALLVCKSGSYSQVVKFPTKLLLF